MIKPVKLTRVEQAIVLLAEYLELPNHDEHHVRKHILEVLGYEDVPKK